MEPLGISVFTIVLFVIIFFITYIYIIYKHIFSLAFMFIHVIFIASFVMCISALFFPVIFKESTKLLFDQTSLSTQLKQTDAIVSDVANAPDKVSDSVKKLLGKEEDKDEDDINVDVYDKTIDLLAGILRWAVFILGLIGMVVATYVRYAYASITMVRDLEERVEDLEEKLKYMPLASSHEPLENTQNMENYASGQSPESSGLSQN